MSTLRTLLLGLALALCLIAALVIFGGENGWIQLLVLVPPSILGGLSLGTPTRGWPKRLARGLLGSTLAAIVALVIILRFPALFPYPADQGAGLYIAILAIVASIPGFSAAAASNPKFGRTLTLGFVLGLSAPLLYHNEIGIVLLLFAGTLAGSGVAKLWARASV